VSLPAQKHQTKF